MTTLQIIRGATFRKVFNFQAAADAAIDITGWAFAMEVRRKDCSRTLILTLSPTITDAAGGEVTVEIADTETEAIDTVGTFETDLKMTTPAGDVIYSPKMMVTISDPVTD